MRLRDVPTPFFEIDSDRELTRVHALAALLVLALVIGVVLLSRPSTPVGVFPVDLSSDPPGAQVFVGDEQRPRGTTPLQVLVTSDDVVRLSAADRSDYLITFVRAQPFHARMLRGKNGAPVLWQVRHTVPGVALGDVRLSPSGRQVTYSVGPQRWGYDLFSEEYRRLDTFELLGGGTISPKGGHALQLENKNGRQTVRLADISKGTTSEVLVIMEQQSGLINDLAWHPSGAYALVALGRGQDGKGRIARFDPFARTFDVLLEIPVSVGGLFRFAPDGQRVTFFVYAGRTVLAYADLRDPSSFRQLGDLALGQGTGQGRLTVNPSSWSTDGRFVYYIAPQSRDLPQDAQEFRRAWPLTMYRHDLVHQPQVVSKIMSVHGDPWYFVRVLEDGTALALLRDTRTGKLELYRVLLEPLTLTYLATLPLIADENIQVEVSGAGTTLFMTNYLDGTLERWVLCLD